MKQTTKIFRIIAAWVMSGSVFTVCNAEDIPVIKTIFNPNSTSQCLVGDKIAQFDDVKCVVSNSSDISFNDKDVEVLEGTIFTITSNTFKNIMGVRLTFETVKATDKIIQIVSAKGSGFKNISELNNVRRNLTSSNAVLFYFSDPHALLSEVQLEMKQNDVLLKVEVTLDVEPEFSVKDGDTIYGDDSVPFVKKSNYMTYQYGIDVKDSNEPDEFYFVPENGIKLTGQTKGQHTVFLDVDLDKTADIRALKTVTVNYDPIKPDEGSTTSINSIVNEEESAYYDLAGRRVAPKSGQLLIRKVGSTSKLIRY